MSSCRIQGGMDKIPNMNWALAKVIKDARESAGISQGELAGFAGLSEIYISSLERGQRGDSINALMLIAGVLKLDASELLRRVEVELKSNPQPPARKPGRPKKI